jgi:hypothetical protein
MRFRKPKISIVFDRPSNCVGIRSFLLDGWNFASGCVWQVGLRLVGLCVELRWQWMSEAKERLFQREAENKYRNEFPCEK